MNDTLLVFDAEVPVNKSKLKAVYTIGGVLFVLSVGCVIWSELHWEQYTHLVQNVITGEVSRTGIASVLYYWGLGFAIAIPVIYGLMGLTLDLKHPALGVNKLGIFINQEGFKKTYLKWDAFERIERRINGELWLYLKDPANVVKQQPAMVRPFLTQTYVKERSPITISPSGSGQKIIGLAIKYGGLVNAMREE
jgi:hypothetical protein